MCKNSKRWSIRKTPVKFVLRDRFEIPDGASDDSVLENEPHSTDYKFSSLLEAMNVAQKQIKQ